MDTKQLEADFQNFIDSCNRLRNSARAILKAEMASEDIKGTNRFSEERLISRAKYFANLGNIDNLGKDIRDSIATKSMRQSLKEIKEYLSVTANKAGD